MFNPKYDFQEQLGSDTFFSERDFLRWTCFNGKISGKTFYQARWTDLNLMSFEFSDCRWISCLLNQTQGTHSEFKNCYFLKTRFENLSLKNLLFENCIFDQCFFQLFSKNEIHFSGLRFSNCFFKESELGDFFNSETVQWIQCGFQNIQTPEFLTLSSFQISEAVQKPVLSTATSAPSPSPLLTHPQAPTPTSLSSDRFGQLEI